MPPFIGLYDNKQAISHLNILLINGLQLFLLVVEEDVEHEVGQDAEKPNEVNGAGDPFEHLDLHALRVRPPEHLQQAVNSSHAVVRDSSQEDGERVEREADLAAGHDFVDAVVEQADHVDQRHQKGAPADDGRALVDEVEELDVFGVGALGLVVHVLGDVGDDEHAEVVHLGGDAEGVD